MQSSDSRAAWALLDSWKTEKALIRISLTPPVMYPDERDVCFRLVDLPGAISEPVADAELESIGIAVGEEVVLVLELASAAVILILADADTERFLRLRLGDGTDCTIREIRSAIGIH